MSGVSYQLPGSSGRWLPFPIPYSLLPALGFLLANLLTGLIFLQSLVPSPPSPVLVPADDTWVTLVYARNFAENLTFSYNEGVAEAGMTSPLWVVLLGTLSWILPLGIPALAQLTGVLLATGASVFVYLIVVRVTGMYAAGALAGLLIALDPTFSFAKVAGSETVLFSMLSLGAVWALLQRRTAAAGIFMALAVLARPEGFLLVGMVIVGALSKWLWEQDDLLALSLDDLGEVFLLTAPPLLVGVAWGFYNWSVTGMPLPNSFYVRNQDFALYDAGNLAAIWEGYLRHTSYLNGVHMVATLGVISAGAYYVLARAGIRAAPLVLMPLLLVYALSVFMPLPVTGWDFSTRRYLDPMLPYVVILLAAGVAMAWEAAARYLESQHRLAPEWRSQLRSTLVAAVAVIAIVPLLGMPFRWLKLPAEYSSNVSNVAEVSIPTARWIDASLPEDAKVGVLAPGALRYFSERPLIDLTGLGNHEAMGKSVFDLAAALDVDYIVAYDDLRLRSWPYAKEVWSAGTRSDAILERDRLVVFQSREKPSLLPGDSVRNTSLEKLRLIDSLDVGDPSDEFDHDWEMAPQVGTLRWAFRTNAADAIEDDARVTTGYESFRVATEPGKDLIIVKRYDAATRGAVRVFVNGQQVGVWRFPPRQYVFGEDQFVIPSSFIKGEASTLRFEHIPDQRGLTSLSSFYYWFFILDDDLDGIS